MISRLEALGFRCLRYVALDLEPFHIFVGPNASGKSTFLDAVAFISDILNHGTEQAILKRGQSLQELAWRREKNQFQLAIEMRVPESIASSFSQNGKSYTHCRYEIQVGVDTKGEGVRLLTENFFLVNASVSQRGIRANQKQLEIFPEDRQPPYNIILKKGGQTPPGWKRVVSLGEEGRAYFRSETTEWNFPLRPGGQKAALAMVPEEERFPISNWAKQMLTEGVQVLALNSRAMREPCRPDFPLTFRPDGSNLPLVVRNLRKNHSESFQRWLRHVQTVFPRLQDIEVLEREVDLHPYLLVNYDNGIKVPAWLLSDGTLRLLALTLLAYLPIQGQVFLIEEPENGIHPKALEAIYQSLSSVYNGQVLCATHSPLLLGLAKPADLLCFALTTGGATDIVRGSEHPALRAWKGQVALDTLYAAGVLG